MEKQKCQTGRPTKLTNEVMAKAEEYINTYSDYNHAFPSIVGLSFILNVSRSSVNLWATKNSRFSDILEKIKEKAELVAWQKGLMGDYNANLVKLLLGKFGYSDRVDANLTSDDGSMSPQPAIKAENLSTQALKEIMAARQANDTHE